MPTALLTGATGFVGSHLADLLLERGWRVRCTVRRTSSLRWLEGKDVERVEADLRTGESLDGACRGVDCVFHVAGVLTAASYDGFRAGNWRASKNMVEAAVRAGVGRFVHVSTLAVAGPSRDGTPVDETMPPRPISRYGKSKWEGEREVRRHEREISVTVLRPPVVYGPRDQGLLPLYQALSFGVQLQVGGHKYFSIIHVRDLVEGILAAAGAGQVFYLANREPGSLRSTTAMILRALGKQRWVRLSVPDALVRALGGVAELLPGPAMFNRDKALEMTQKYWVCTAAKAERELGFTARVPLEEGLRETIAWFRGAGLLS